MGLWSPEEGCLPEGYDLQLSCLFRSNEFGPLIHSSIRSFIYLTPMPHAVPGPIVRPKGYNLEQKKPSYGLTGLKV